MPQPLLLTQSDGRWGQRTVVKFGGLAIPVLGGTLAYMDLNAGGPWYALDVQMATGKKLPISALAWRGKGVFMGIDFQELVVTIPFRYDESGGNNLFADLTTMQMAGTQNLTFDNLTALQCRLLSAGPPKLVVTSSPFLWEGTLTFHAAIPWFLNLTASTLGSTTFGAIPITYTGTVWGEPVYTITVGATNAAPITTMTIANSVSGESVTMYFYPTLTATTAWTITVNTQTLKVTDNNGLEYDVTGAFPLLYPGAQTLTFSATVVSGSLSNTTVAGTWNNRYGPPA